jgi:membrane protein
MLERVGPSAWQARAERAGDRYQELARRHSLLGLPPEFLSRYHARQGMLLASATAFRLFLWLLPVSLMLAGIMSKVSSDDPGSANSAVRASGVTGSAGQQIVDTLRTGNRSWWIAVLVGAVGTLMASRALTRSLSLVNAHLWQVPPQGQRGRRAMGTTLVFLGAIFAIMGLGVVAPQIDGFVAGGVVLTLLIEIAGASGAWLLLSMRFPDARLDVTDLLPGAVLFGVALAVTHTAGRIYLPPKIEQASQLYGGLGVAVVMAGWLLVIGQIMVASPLLNAVMLSYRGRSAETVRD